MIPLSEDMPADMLGRAKKRVGTILKDKWRLDALLGVGGMAAVYAATHRNKKRVAVKVLHADFSSNPDTRSRFLREGYAANVIEHPGAVSVLDDDVAEDGSAFLVMELLEGETLDRRAERQGGRLPVREVLGFTDQLLDVLSAANAKGIVHRDIKPENLFVTREGSLKILDFGIARVFESRQDSKQATRAGQIIGTPAFMAPEQALAAWENVDGRTDIWAVGATMFTLISGRHVHEAPTGTAQLVFTATRPAPSIGAVVQGVPPAVVAVVDRALAFDRDQRWADARSMQSAVRAAAGSAGEAVAQPAVVTVPAPSGAIPVAARSGSLPDFGDAAHAADSAQLKAAVASRAAERDARVKEVAQGAPVVAELRQRHAAAKQKVADAQARVTAARNERLAQEEWFKKHVGSRASAAEQARKSFNAALAGFARSVVADAETFGADFEAARAEISRLTRQADAAQHDVAVHTAALTAYDRKTFTTGVVIAAAALVLGLILFFMPVILRFLADT